MVIPKVSDTNYTFDNFFHGYESGVLVYKKELTGAVYDGEPGALWSRTEYNTYLNGLKVGIYTEEESGDDYRSKGNGKENNNSKIVGGGAETHNYYCSYDGQGNISQVSNMAGDMPYNMYAYDSYGGQIGDDYYNEDFAGYKGYDRGPFGYKTGVRHYDPETGRFLSPDPFKGYMTDPGSQHPYMYCHGNPVRFYDPTGYESFIFYNKPGPNGEAGMHKLIAESYQKKHLPKAIVKQISTPDDIEKFTKGKKIDYLVIVGHGSEGYLWTNMMPDVDNDCLSSNEVAGLKLNFKRIGKPKLPRVQIYACLSAVAPDGGMSIAEAFSKAFKVSARGLLSTGGYSGVEFGVPGQNLPKVVPSNYKGVFMVPENRTGVRGYKTFYP